MNKHLLNVRGSKLLFLLLLLLIYGSAKAQVTQFARPGVPFTLADLTQLKANITQEPWLTGYNALRNDARSKLDYSMRGPFTTVTRAPNLNNDAWKSDMQAIHNLTFMYVFTGDSAYARKATNMLDLWARTNTSWGGNESMLDIGDFVPYFVPAADILRSTFPGWSVSNSTNVEKYFRDVLYPHSWVPAPLRDHNKGAIMLEIAIGIAAYLGDPVRFQQAIETYRMDAGGGLRNSLPNGEVGDTGRDDHWWVQIQALGWSAEVAWKQGVDLFSELDNRLLAMSELYHRYSLSPAGTIPFIPFGGYSAYYVNWGIPTGVRRHSPFNNIIENAYSRRKGISTPYTTQMRNLMGENSWSFLYLKSADSSQATALTPIIYPGDTAVAVTSMTNMDIGNTGIAGGLSFADGNWTVKGAGNSLSNALNFTFRRVKGDVAIVVKVDNTSLSTSNCGVMLRESLATNARYMSIGIAATGGISTSHYLPKIPWWFKLERVGDRIFTYHSKDGIHWTNLALSRQTFTDSYIGFYTLSNNTSALNTATFSNLKISTGSPATAPEITSQTSAVAKSNTPFNHTVLASNNPVVFRASNLPAGLAIDSLSGIVSGTPTVASGSYAVNLEAQNAAGKGYATLIINVSNNATPALPTGVTASVSNTTRISVNWTAVANTSSYTVKRSLSASGPFVTLQAGITGTSFIDANPEPEIDNFYVVTALAGELESESSAVVSASVPPAVPTKPLVINKPSQIELKWGSASGALTYKVKRGLVSGGPYTTIATIADTTYVDADITPGNPYYYVVSSAGNTKESGNSIEAFGFAGASTSTWNPVPLSDSLNLAGNWLENTLPVNPAILTFGASSDTLLVNNINNLEVTRINFAENANAYTISGDTIKMKDDLVNASSRWQTINTAILLEDQLYVNSGPGNITLNGVISGSGGVTRNGAGSLYLTGLNTFTGNTVINGSAGGWPPVQSIVISGHGTGTQSVPTTGPLGKGKVIMNGGSLYSGTDATIYNDIEIKNERRSYIFQTSAALNLRGRLLGNGTVEQDGNTTAGLHLYGDNSDFEGTFISKLRSGNSRTRFEAAQSGSAKASWLLDNTGNDTQSLQFTSGTISFGSLSGRGAIRCNNAGTRGMSVGALNLNSTFSGNISTVSGAALNFEKVGTGTLILSGNNTFGGSTTVKKGKLLVNNNPADGSFSSPVLVEEGAFGGSGRTTNTVVVGAGNGAGAVLEPGNSAIGTFTCGALTLRADATYAVEFNPSAATADKIVTSGINLQNQPNLSVTATVAAEIPEGTKLTIIDNTGSGAVTGIFKDKPEMSLITVGSNNFRLTYKGGTGNDVQLIDDRIVPVVITSDIADTTLHGRPYTYAIKGIKSPDTFTASGLPPGLVLDNATGTISGSPSEIGVFPITVTAANASTADTLIFMLTVMNTTVSNVVVAENDAKAIIEWDAIPGFTYNVKRTAVSGGPYSVINTVGTAKYTDAGLTNGTTYYYVISGVESEVEYTNSAEVSVKPKSGQALFYRFDELSGTKIRDFWGANHGSLLSAVQRSGGRSGNAIKLDGTANSYATLPAGIVSSLNDFTIATWIKMDAKSNWMRVFDFGTGTATHMFLTVQAGAANAMRYAIKNNNSAEQQVSYTYTLPLNSWTHFAITQSGNICRMYINGALAATNTNVTFKPSTLGNTTLNYLGKSQFNDPIFNGSIDDFRIYSRALEASEIAEIGSTVLPVNLISFNLKQQSSGSVMINWETASESNNDYFVIERSSDGKSFSKIGAVVRSLGNGASYSFTDEQPQSGANYYRLRQVDKDGSSTDLATRMVNVTLKSDHGFEVYPNPVISNIIRFNMPDAPLNEVPVSITDLTGKKLFSGSAKKGADGLYKLELLQKPDSGIYIISTPQYTSKLIIE